MELVERRLKAKAQILTISRVNTLFANGTKYVVILQIPGFPELHTEAPTPFHRSDSPSAAVLYLS